MKIAVISGSRADKGGLLPVAQELSKAHDVEFLDMGECEIDEDEVLGSDLVIVLGDRFEILRAATTVFLAKIPIAHLSGGDITEGSQDDSMRHAITKLSHLHFVTNEQSAKRVIQMGEEPWRVHVVGYPGASTEIAWNYPDAKRLADISSFPDDFILVIWHPNTLAGSDEVLTEVKTLTKALDQVNKKTLVIGPNADANNMVVRRHLQDWAHFTGNKYCETLPRAVYLSLLANCGCLVGNSSSGYYEAPSYGTPIVDIGDRQKGRKQPVNMIKSSIFAEAIAWAIELAFEQGRTKPGNPYNKVGAAEQISKVISELDDPKKLLRKKWYEIRQPEQRRA